MTLKWIEIRWEESWRCWRLYWSPSRKLADRRRFKTMKEAGAVANALLDPKVLELRAG